MGYFELANMLGSSLLGAVFGWTPRFSPNHRKLSHKECAKMWGTTNLASATQRDRTSLFGWSCEFLKTVFKSKIIHSIKDVFS